MSKIFFYLFTVDVFSMLRCFVGAMSTLDVGSSDSVSFVNCFQPKAKGHGCEPRGFNVGQRSIRFYYNSTTNSCFAFGYGGCGGNKNNFQSLRDCERACKSDEPLYTCSPSINDHSSVRVDNFEQCPDGTIARSHVEFIDFTCCDSFAEEAFIHASGSCFNSAVPQLTSAEDYNTTLLGDSCDDLPCDEGYHCLQISIFAKCCPMENL